MKALVGWNTLYQVPELIKFYSFLTRIKNDMYKEIDLYGTQKDLHGTKTYLYGTITELYKT